MKKVFGLMAAVAVMGLTGACGQLQDKGQQDQNSDDSVQSAALQSDYSSLPQGVMVRVPVDAQGKPMTEQADMRTTTATDLNSEASIQSAFESGQAVPTVAKADEVSRDNGNRSWHDWHQQNYQGYNHSCNLVGGYSQCGQNQYGQYSQYGQYNNQYYPTTQYNQYSNCGQYSCSSYYMNTWRPAAYSQQIAGGYWYYQQPQYWTYQHSCQTNCGYQYYYYQRPQCTHYQWCGNTNQHQHHQGCGHQGW